MKTDTLAHYTAQARIAELEAALRLYLSAGTGMKVDLRVLYEAHEKGSAALKKAET